MRLVRPVPIVNSKSTLSPGMRRYTTQSKVENYQWCSWSTYLHVERSDTYKRRSVIRGYGGSELLSYAFYEYFMISARQYAPR